MQWLAVAAFSIGSVIAAGSTPAAGSIRVPLLGYVQISPGELRPVAGFVGANILVDPVSFGAGVKRVFVSPGQDFVIVEGGDPTQIGVARLDATGLGESSPIPGALSEMDGLSFSPSGRTAVLYSNRLQKLQVIAGLPEEPRIAQDRDVSSMGGTLLSAGVSDDAEMALAAFSAGGTVFVTQIQSGAAFQSVLKAAAVSAIRFFPHSHAAVLSDPVSNEILLLGEDTSSTGSLSARLLAAEAAGVLKPSDLEISPDGARIFVANSGGGNVLIIGPGGGTPRVVPCGFTPAKFQHLMKSVIGVVAEDTESVSVLDANAASPWLAFAPGVRARH